MHQSKVARIAISGTPGCGKSTLVGEIINFGNCSGLKFEATSVYDLASEFDCLGEIDSADDARPIDVESLKSCLEGEWKNSAKMNLVIDGHLSHLLDVDAIVVIRCHPDTITKRLLQREYPLEKVQENVEWELIGSVWSDIAQVNSIPILELNSTANDTSSLIEQFLNWVRDGFKPNTPAHPIDWIEIIHGD